MDWSLRLTPADKQKFRDELMVRAGAKRPDRNANLGFGFSRNRMKDYDARAPHWFFVAAATSLAVALRPAPRRKFSVRDVLVLVTVAVLAIGALTILRRNLDAVP
jgi:hypothetical protein